MTATRINEWTAIFAQCSKAFLSTYVKSGLLMDEMALALETNTAAPVVRVLDM